MWFLAKLKNQLILLFHLFLLLFMRAITLFSIIHGPYCTISANFYSYLQYFHVNQKLAGWKANLLSFAGRKVLIQATTYAIPSYVMQTNFLPSRLLDNLDRLNRNFLWGFSEPKRRMHWVGWEKITQPLDKGGLGLQTAKGSLSFKAELEVPCRKRLVLGPGFKKKIYDPKKNVF